MSSSDPCQNVRNFTEKQIQIIYIINKTEAIQNIKGLNSLLKISKIPDAHMKLINRTFKSGL